MVNLRISYSVDRVTGWLVGIAAYLAIQSISARRIQELFDDAPRLIDRFTRLVNINLEKSIPTWYATMLLIFAALLVILIAYGKGQELFRRRWLGLAIIFTYLSIDEATEFHEEFTKPLRNALDISGFLHFAWVIPGVIFFAIVALVYLRFIWQLPKPVRDLVFTAGAVFITGAVLIESYSANLYADTGTTLTFSAIGTVEEFFEMLGVILFIRAMLTYLQTDVVDVGDSAIE